MTVPDERDSTAAVGVSLWQAGRVFDGQVAIVTGAGRGMGKEIALTFARGMASVIVIDRNAEDAQDTAAAARRLGAKAVDYACDVSDSTQVTEVIQRVLDTFGAPQILVNNAGIAFTTRPLETIDDAAWESTLRVNLTGVFNLMRAMLPEMKRLRRGKIVNVSSSAGRSLSTFAGAHYSASKAGVIGLTRHAAYEAAPFNININAIAPGTIDTPMLRGAVDQHRIQAEAEKIPIRRLGSVVDIANLVAFLSSSAADYITGATIDINGGDLIL